MGLLDGLLTGAGGALISGVGSFLGANEQNANSIKAQNNQMQDNALLQTQANAYNVQNATTAFNRSQEQLGQVEQYDTNMANTAFQRQVADLKAAGLNPILGMGTSGAPSPTVSSSNPASPSIGGSSVGLPSMQSALGNAISSAMQGSKLIPQVQQAVADAQNAAKTGDILDATKASKQSEADHADDYWKSLIGQNNANAGASSATAQLNQSNKSKVDQDVSNNSGGGSVTLRAGTSGPLRALGLGADGSITFPVSSFGKVKDYLSGFVPAYSNPATPSPTPPRVITGNPTGGASLGD